MEETLGLKEIGRILKKRLALIMAITFLAAFTSGIISYFLLTPVYQASTQILVNQAKNDQELYSATEVQTNLQLINTYSVIIQSPAVLDKVSNNLAMGLTTDQLQSQIMVSSEQDSQVINLSVTDVSQGRAADIANETARVFQKEIMTIMNVDNVSILAQAEISENSSPVTPQPFLNTIIAACVGLLLGIGIAFLLEYLDNTIKSEQDIEKMLELPVLGTIATIKADGKKEKMPNSLQPKEAGGEGIGL